MSIVQQDKHLVRVSSIDRPTPQVPVVTNAGAFDISDGPHMAVEQDRLSGEHKSVMENIREKAHEVKERLVGEEPPSHKALKFEKKFLKELKVRLNSSLTLESRDLKRLKPLELSYLHECAGQKNNNGLDRKSVV